MSDTREIKTNYVYPPIPVRCFDWEAFRDGWDIDEPIGYGKTEKDAIEDLLEREREL